MIRDVQVDGVNGCSRPGGFLSGGPSGTSNTTFDLVSTAWERLMKTASHNSAEHIYSIADNHVQTVQVCIDRLHQLGASEQLKLLTERLQRLSVRATPEDDNKGAQATP